MSAKSKCYCSFCGKRDDEVPKLIAGPASIYICNECVELSAQICVADGLAIDPVPGLPLPQQENTMRTEPEQALALECLRLANGSHAAMPGNDPVAEAERFYAFVTGANRTAAADAAKAAIDELARQPAIAPINFGELVKDYVDRREVLEGRTGFPAPQSPAGGDDGQ